WTITDNKIRIKYPSRVREMRYRLDDAQKPKAITMTPLPEIIRGIALALEGIYDLNGDELTVFWNRNLPGERPGSFDRKPREPWAFFVLKRAPDAEADKLNATEFIGRVVAVSKDAQSFTFEGTALK